jgi:hypothetical protein
MVFSRSLDDGVTWTPAANLAAGGKGAFVAVGPDHSVYAFWLDGQTLRLRRSVDQGATFGASTVVATLLTTGGNGALPITPMRSNAFLHAAVNPITGNVYVVFNDDPAGADKGDIFFSQSLDHGATWSPRVKVNTDTSGRDQWQPTIAVADEGNRALVSWYDRRNAPDNSAFQRFSTVMKINGNTVNIGKNFFSSPFSRPVVGQDPVINATYMGDYDHATQTTANFVFTYSDNRDSNTVHSAQPDVRAGSVPKTPASADLAVNVTPAANPVPVATVTNLTVAVTNNGPNTATNVGVVAQLSGKLAVQSIKIGRAHV